MQDDRPIHPNLDDEEGEPRGGPWWKRALRVVLPLVVLAVGIGLVVVLVSTAPEPERDRPPPERPGVEVVRARAMDTGPAVEALGAVAPARQVELFPEVRGVVAWLSPSLVAGGRFMRGEPVVRIDPRELELAVAEQRARIADAQLVLAQERAEQRVRERTRALFPEDEVADYAPTPEARRLSRREQHVERAQRLLEAARADLARAELDLERTEVRSPCDCVVQGTTVALGARVGLEHPIATLVETSAYHVEVSVPVETLSGIEVSSPARVTMPLEGREHRWMGRVVRLAPGLTERGSMAQLLVEVPDPLGLGEPSGQRSVPLLLGSFVRVEIVAAPIEGAVLVPRAGLREGNRVWVVDPRDRLEMRPVAVAWRMEDAVLVTDGVAPGERVIVSRLTAPVEGMDVRPSPPPDELRVAAGGVP